MVPRELDSAIREAAKSDDNTMISEGTTNVMEPEYHTDSDASNSSENELESRVNERGGDESDHDSDSRLSVPPLLPAELLKAQSTFENSTDNLTSTSWKSMSRKDKRTERHRSRQRKKRAWDKLRRDAEGTGVLEAGKAAQLKRRVAPPQSKVKSGRVAKKTKPTTSGRQHLLEQRKRAVRVDNKIPRKPKR